jgi:hypothetical protein
MTAVAGPKLSLIYMPRGAAKADIVFIHGLDGDAETTWISPDTKF